MEAGSSASIILTLNIKRTASDPLDVTDSSDLNKESPTFATPASEALGTTDSSATISGEIESAMATQNVIADYEHEDNDNDGVDDDAAGDSSAFQLQQPKLVIFLVTLITTFAIVKFSSQKHD